MSQCLFSLGVFLPLLAGVPAPEKVEPPKGPPPTLQMVYSVDRDKGIINVAMGMQVQVTVNREIVKFIEVGGKRVAVKELQPYVEERTVNKLVPYKVSDDEISATDVFGKKLEKSDVLKKVTPGKIIAVCSDRNGLDPAYRAALARDVVILIVPQSRPGPFILPPPAPKELPKR